MIRTYFALFGLSLCIVLGAFIWVQSEELKKARFSLGLAEARAEAAKYAAQQSAKVEAVTRTVYVRAEKAKADVRQTDPQCSNPQSTLDAWRAGIASLHEAHDGVGDTESRP
ncbi:hypothetical protein [Asticcacaulis sp.]|uniref:hypothetical protein n=1 Tax=Asticcacaulis sp. TaxID=1872648 RepID=UPI0031DB687E